MDFWLDFEIPDARVQVALAALLAAFMYRLRAAEKRHIAILLSRSDKKAAEREQATKAFIDRIDREAAEREAQYDEKAENRERAFQAALDRSD